LGKTAEVSSGDELLKLNNQLCFALYVCSKEVIRKYKPLLDPLGLTYTSYITLLALWEEDGITVKTLGEKLFLDSGTLTPLLKKMEKDGWLTRCRGSDERTVTISLTPKSEALKIQARTIPEKLICTLNLDLQEAVNLLRNLHLMMDNIRSPLICKVSEERKV
jgi:DNA-binding MarR family transcriptional regulator